MVAALLFEIPTPLTTQESEIRQSEYPSATFLTSSLVFVSDGHGSLYILDITDEYATLLGTFILPSAPESLSDPVPFKIHEVALMSGSTVTLVLSSRHYTELTPSDIATPPKNRNVHVEFDIWGVTFSFPISEDPDQITPMQVLWRRRGDDVPMYVAHSAERSAFLLLGSSTYRPADAPKEPSYTPSADEVAPIPRADEQMDADPQLPEKPPPYSWTQSPDSVTVAFPLPSSTNKSDIRVNFSPRTVTLHVTTNESTPLPLPHYSAQNLWDPISPSSSFWTWDKEGDRAYGILTLHLDKQQEGLKWMHVFASSSQPGDSNLDVPETLDPSELWAIRESLEKYTAALNSGEDASGLGLGKGMPSLAEGEMDEEVDSSVGRQAIVSWVADDGVTPPWATSSTQSPFVVLATPFPGAQESQIPSLVTKTHVDGTLFALSTSSPASWEHISTFSALSFVLASKQDTRFTYHIPYKAAFAFENGSGDRGGNIYIYQSCSLLEQWAKQSVLKISEGDAGSLLGVCALKTESQNVILCLTENELVVVANII
ncbi:hypothetical protein ONZ45_g8327 [Pleurotus djamor]|nr:hypothetical protein ONZ45_g8327 [Pleurotus djamor]